MELLHRQAFFMKHFAAMPQNMKRILRCMKRHCVPWSKAWRLHSAIFFAKKWRRAFLSSPAILKGFLSLKTQNFAVKWNSENRFNFVHKNSESFLPSHIPVYQRQPRNVWSGIVIEQTKLKKTSRIKHSNLNTAVMGGKISNPYLQTIIMFYEIDERNGQKVIFFSTSCQAAL